MAYSTISVSPKVKKRLESMRIYRRETFDELLERVMDDAQVGDEEGDYSEGTKEGLKRGLSDMRAGRTIPFADVLAKHGIRSK